MLGLMHCHSGSMLPQTAAAGARQAQWLATPPSSVCRLCGKPDSHRSSSWQQQSQSARQRSRGASVAVRAASLLDTLRQGLGLGLGLGPAAPRVDISTYTGGQVVPVAAEVGALLGEVFFAKANFKLREQVEQRFFVVECVLNLLWRFSLPFLGNRLTLLVARDPDTEEILGVGEVAVNKCDGYIAQLLDLKRGTPVVQINNMAVAPAARGRGIGKELVRVCQAEARKQEQCSIMLLYVYKNNTPAIKLYRGTGFSEVAGYTDSSWSNAAPGKIAPPQKVLLSKQL